jgi:hypothetical protein
MGTECGKVVTTGDKNIYLGFETAKDATTGDNNICIGGLAAPSANNVSNEITLGDTSITKFRIPGINFTVKDTTATEDYVLTVDANGEAGWEAASGGGGDNGLLQMAQTVSTSVTLTTNYNAFSVQPTVASGVTVTVPSGAVWAII